MNTIGLIARLLGKKILRQEIKKLIKSYWIFSTINVIYSKVNYKLVMYFLIEFWKFLKVRKKFWLLPIYLLLMLFGGLIVLSQGSVVAPFIYTLF